MGCMGKRIISARITVVDDATNKAYVGAKGITCEGLPTKRTELITKGVLTDLLSDWYETNRTLHCDPQAAEKLGADPQLLYREGKLLPTSGFRFNQGGGRGYDLSPGTSGTNTMIYSDDAKPLEALIQKVQNGIFIGRIWYCYPINGACQGDFTATVIADSFVIRDGKITAPLKANAIRINDNILRVLNAIDEVSDEKASCILWAADEVHVACSIAVSGVRVEEICAHDPATPTGM